jgi:hypothetical protein
MTGAQAFFHTVDAGFSIGFGASGTLHYTKNGNREVGSVSISCYNDVDRDGKTVTKDPVGTLLFQWYLPSTW